MVVLFFFAWPLIMAAVQKMSEDGDPFVDGQFSDVEEPLGVAVLDVLPPGLALAASSGASSSVLDAGGLSAHFGLLESSRQLLAMSVTIQEMRWDAGSAVPRLDMSVPFSPLPAWSFAVDAVFAKLQATLIPAFRQFGRF